jgi:hypothetical protein
MVKAALEQDLGREGIDKATELLKPCFGGSKARALTALTKLYQCGYDNVCLYKELVTLREDLDIERIVLHSGSHAESLNRYRSQPPVVAEAPAGTAGVGGTLTLLSVFACSLKASYLPVCKPLCYLFIVLLNMW